MLNALPEPLKQFEIWLLCVLAKALRNSLPQVFFFLLIRRLPPIYALDESLLELIGACIVFPLL